jgi:hypothetical protein
MDNVRVGVLQLDIRLQPVVQNVSWRECFCREVG